MHLSGLSTLVLILSTHIATTLAAPVPVAHGNTYDSVALSQRSPGSSASPANAHVQAANAHIQAVSKPKSDKIIAVHSGSAKNKAQGNEHSKAANAHGQATNSKSDPKIAVHSARKT